MAGALLDLFEFLDKYKIDRYKGVDNFSTGDVVACFDEDTGKVLGLGTVKHVGKTNLCEEHSDGDFGEVFVLPFNKGRAKGGTPYNKQEGWWMYGEVDVLPKQNEEFSLREIAKNVMYVGHKATTRNEQIQQNYLVD